MGDSTAHQDSYIVRRTRRWKTAKASGLVLLIHERISVKPEYGVETIWLSQKDNNESIPVILVNSP